MFHLKFFWKYMFPTRTSSVNLAFVTYASILLRKQAISKPIAATSLTVNIFSQSTAFNDIYIGNQSWKSDVAKLKLSELCMHACINRITVNNKLSRICSYFFCTWIFRTDFSLSQLCILNVWSEGQADLALVALTSEWSPKDFVLSTEDAETARLWWSCENNNVMIRTRKF